MRQVMSNACYDHEACADCGSFAPDGKPCACDCHTAVGGELKEVTMNSPFGTKCSSCGNELPHWQIAQGSWQCEDCEDEAINQAAMDAAAEFDAMVIRAAREAARGVEPTEDTIRGEDSEWGSYHED